MEYYKAYYGGYYDTRSLDYCSYGAMGDGMPAPPRNPKYCNCSVVEGIFSGASLPPYTIGRNSPNNGSIFG